MIKAVIFDMYETLITHYASPLYFSEQMAADAGIETELFRKMWRDTNDERTEGKMTFEEIIEKILRQNGKYSEDVFEKIVAKRMQAKTECFRHLHMQILPMLDGLHNQGIAIGLISNCFSEEVTAIRKSVLFPYFDGVFLSYEQGIQKPNEEIFVRCMKKLNVRAKECIYVGDGGSRELETARNLGMYALQAVWYLKEEIADQSKRKDGFEQIENPMDLLERIKKK